MLILPAQSSDELKALSKNPLMVIEVIRHGIRAPTTSAYDPYWHGMTGELLPQGIRQTYILGKAINLKYPHLFSKYSPDEVYVRAINLNRTLMSAVSHLTGTYGFGFGKNLTNVNLKDINVPYNYSPHIIDGLGEAALPHNYILPQIHTVEFEHDYMLYAFNSETCPIAKKLKKEQQESEYYLDYKEKMQPTITKLSELTGQDFKFSDISNFYSTLNINSIMNRTFPEPYDRIEVGSELWKNLTFIHDFNEFYGSYGSKQQVQLYSSLLLAEILGFLERHVNGSNTNFKYALYSGSDTLLMPLLHALGIASHECFAERFFNGTKNDLCMYPTFASNLIFELHQEDEEFYVKVKYNDKVANLCLNPEKKCRYQDFKDILEQVIDGMDLEEFLKVCQVTSHQRRSKHVEFSNTQFILFAIIFIVMTSGFFLSKYSKKNKKIDNSQALLGIEVVKT